MYLLLAVRDPLSGVFESSDIVTIEKKTRNILALPIDQYHLLPNSVFLPLPTLPALPKKLLIHLPEDHMTLYTQLIKTCLS